MALSSSQGLSSGQGFNFHHATTPPPLYPSTIYSSNNNFSHYPPFHYYASLSSFRHGSTCAGSILNSLVILTAAHCVYDSLPRDWTVTLSADTGLESKDILISHIIIHEQFNSTKCGENDIALVVLLFPLSFGGLMAPVVLPKWPAQFKNMNRTTLSIVAFEAPPPDVFGIVVAPPTRLTGSETDMVEVRVLHERCATQAMLAIGAMCTRSADLRRLCKGNSGTPLTTIDDDGVRYLVGIGSLGPMCQAPNRNICILGTFTNVSQHLPWIAKQMEEINSWMSGDQWSERVRQAEMDHLLHRIQLEETLNHLKDSKGKMARVREDYMGTVEQVALYRKQLSLAMERLRDLKGAKKFYSGSGKARRMSKRQGEGKKGRKHRQGSFRY